MYTNVSSDFISVLNRASRTFLARITAGNQTITNIKSYTLVSGSCGSDVFSIGTVFSSYVNIALPIQDITLADTEFFLETGIVLDDGSVEYIPMGYFTAGSSDVKKSRDQIVINASDRITSKCRRVYTPSVSFPATIASIISDISSQAGITISTSLTTSGTVEEAFPTMYYSDALGYLAGMLGGFCYADRTGVIRIEAFPDTETLEVSNERILQLSVDEAGYTLERLSVTVQKGDEDSEDEETELVVYTSGSGTGIDLYNPYMTETLFNTLASAVIGYSFDPGTVAFLGDPRLDPVDAITAVNYEDAEYLIPCMNITQTFDGGLKTTVTAPGMAVSDQAAQGPLTQMVGNLETEAILAKKSAESAKASADEAYASAVSATNSANSALTQLSVVEDVVGTLSWITDHGTYELSEDTEVVSGKYYFTRENDTYSVVINPQGDPSGLGYYELSSVDEAVSNYVSSHLALTSAGLWVTNDNQSYKILLCATGMKVYDASGNLVATFGESITFSSSRPQYIGSEDAYIIFYDSDSDGVPDAINIGGSKVTLGGSKKLSDLLTTLDISTQQTSTGAEITIGDKTVTLQNGADAAVLRIDSSRGTVFKNNQVSTVLTVSIYSGGNRITNSTDLKSIFGNTAYLQWYWQRLGEDTYGVIVSTDSKLSDDGFTLTLTPEQVDTKVTFMCELIV